MYELKFDFPYVLVLPSTIGQLKIPWDFRPNKYPACLKMPKPNVDEMMLMKVMEPNKMVPVVGFISK